MCNTAVYTELGWGDTSLPAVNPPTRWGRSNCYVFDTSVLERHPRTGSSRRPSLIWAPCPSLRNRATNTCVTGMQECMRYIVMPDWDTALIAAIGGSRG
ncbi:hypothetical protein FKM82_018431 [Ascaphus truei]